jgi:hypothetical protein
MAFIAYGLVVDSDLPLDLPPAEGPADLTIRRLRRQLDGGLVEWTGAPDGDWESGRLADGRFALRFGREIDLVVDQGGMSLGWWSPRRPSPTLVHLVLDHALPQAMMRRGRLVLHASCLATSDNRCFALAGESGRGKSSLTRR